MKGSEVGHDADHANNANARRKAAERQSYMKDNAAKPPTTEYLLFIRQVELHDLVIRCAVTMSYLQDGGCFHQPLLR